MDLTKCEMGHYYDKDKYDRCPHCNNHITDDEYFYKEIKDLKKWSYIQSIKQELLKINHKNIVQVFDIYTNENNYIKESFIKGNTIDNLIINKQITLEDFLNIGIDICNAIKYLNDNNFIHMDIKPSNIMYDKLEKKAILIDIESIYRKKLLQKTNYFGTIEYSSPEQITYSTYSIEGSIYSLGLVFYKILMNKLPFDISKNGILKKSMQELELDFNHSADFKYKTIIIKLIKKMVFFKPEKRIKINKIIHILYLIKKKSSKDELKQNINNKEEYPLLNKFIISDFEENKTVALNIPLEYIPLEEIKDKNKIKDSIYKVNLTYHNELLKEYSNILNQAKITFWCWISSLLMCYIIIGVCIYLVLVGRFVDSICSVLLEGLIYAVQNIFSVREDHYRDLINNKIAHLQKGDFFEYATSKVEILNDNDKKDVVIMDIIKDIRKEAIK